MIPSTYLGEFVGTAILILLGNGVVANVLLAKTKGHGSGLIVITLGWGMAVFVAVLCVMDVSGAHLNPAVTVGLASAGKFDWNLAFGYVAAQMLGGFTGAVLVYIFYYDHYNATTDANAQLSSFCTGPNIRNLPLNVFCEIVGTFVLVFAVLMAAEPKLELTFGGGVLTNSSSTLGLGAVGALPVGLVVFAIGVSLGGTTGYAINPARDLAPRIAHMLLPISGKRDSDWSYSWVPVIGPLLGGWLAAMVYSVFP